MKNYLFAVVLTLSTIATAQLQKSELPLPHSGDVTLPLDQYNKLLELASKPTKRPVDQRRDHPRRTTGWQGSAARAGE